MCAEAFHDTNVVIYAFIEAGRRSVLAEELVATGGTVSVQVLNEFVNVARRKHALAWREIRGSLLTLQDACGAARPLTKVTHDTALAIAERYGYRIYDALIIAAAAEAGCRTLYSEDLADDQQIAGVRIVNPFA